MPWTAKQFAAKHWTTATLAQAARAAKTANALLRAGADEGRAIATGIKVAKTRHNRNAPRATKTRRSRK